MEPYNIKQHHQETANHSEHSFVYCTVTGLTRDTNTQHLHDETNTSSSSSFRPFQLWQQVQPFFTFFGSVDLAYNSKHS